MAKRLKGGFFSKMNWMIAACVGTIVGPLVTAGSTQAAVITFTGATDGAWSDPLNWDLERVPNDTDSVDLDGKIVNISDHAAHIEMFANGSAGTVNINSGGLLTGDHNYTVRYVSGINVNDGGELAMGTAWTIRSNIVVNDGGTASGAASTSTNEVRSITVNGTWSPRGTDETDGTAFTVGNYSVNATTGAITQRPGSVLMGSTGEFVLDVYGNGVNEFFDVRGLTSATVLEMDSGTVELRTQGGYTPVVGDSFDLWDLEDGSLATMSIGDGSNIVLPGYELDLSQWETDGIVTVSGGGTAIPEPASLAVLGLGALAMLRRRR